MQLISASKSHNRIVDLSLATTNSMTLTSFPLYIFGYFRISWCVPSADVLFGITNLAQGPTSNNKQYIFSKQCVFIQNDGFTFSFSFNYVKGGFHINRTRNFVINEWILINLRTTKWTDGALLLPDNTSILRPPITLLLLRAKPTKHKTPVNIIGKTFD